MSFCVDQKGTRSVCGEGKDELQTSLGTPATRTWAKQNSPRRACLDMVPVGAEGPGTQNPDHLASTPHGLQDRQGWSPPSGASTQPHAGLCKDPTPITACLTGKTRVCQASRRPWGQ